MACRCITFSSSSRSRRRSTIIRRRLSLAHRRARAFPRIHLQERFLGCPASTYSSNSLSSTIISMLPANRVCRLDLRLFQTSARVCRSGLLLMAYLCVLRRTLGYLQLLPSRRLLHRTQ